MSFNLSAEKKTVFEKTVLGILLYAGKITVPRRRRCHRRQQASRYPAAVRYP